MENGKVHELSLSWLIQSHFNMTPIGYLQKAETIHKFMKSAKIYQKYPENQKTKIMIDSLFAIIDME